MGLPLQQSMQPLAEELEDFLEAAGVLRDDRSTLFHQRLVALADRSGRRLVIGRAGRCHRGHRQLVLGDAIMHRSQRWLSVVGRFDLSQGSGSLGTRKLG